MARWENDKFVSIADRFEGKRFNSPYDVVVKSNDDIYFTDPPYGLPENVDDPTKEIPFQGLSKAVWMAFPVNADGTLGAGRVFLDLTDSPDAGVPDGLKVDQRGNLWATGPGGVLIISPEGKHLGTLATGQAESHRQVIFTSHNANLVANGDAEFIICCDYRTTATESGGQIKFTGAIDVPEINHEIAEVMEGGGQAFKLRHQKYGF